MSFQIDAPAGARIVTVRFQGELSRDEFITSIERLADGIDTDLSYLVVLSKCALAMSASEFMGAIDVWFEQISGAPLMALVFDAETQKDQAMLFDTKSFLIGGRQKAFMDDQAALDWLASGD